VAKATEFNQPMLDATVPFDATGKNPLEWGFANISDSNIAPTGLKGAEDGNGVVMHVFESTGAATSASLKINAPLTNDHWVNFIEDPLGPAYANAGMLPLKLHGFEIRCVKFERPIVPRRAVARKA